METQMGIEEIEEVPLPHFPDSAKPVFRGRSVPFLQKVFKLFAVLPAVIQMLNDAVIANCARQVCALKTQEQDSRPCRGSPRPLPPPPALREAMAQLGASVPGPLSGSPINYTK